MEMEEEKKKSKWNVFSMEGCTNQWVRLATYCLACLLTSCLYFGWQDYSTMIIRSGAYSWKCVNGGTPVDDADDPALCLEQSKAVAALYPYANGSEFVCAAVAGVMLDTFGPRLTATVGELLHLLSMLLLILSSESFRAYIPALVLAGACVNVIAFPSLTVMEHWPNRQALAVSIIVGCQSAASVVPPILRKMWDKNPNWTFRGIWGVWLLVVWLPVATTYIFSLPPKRNYKSLLNQEKSAASVVDEVNVATLEYEPEDKQTKSEDVVTQKAKGSEQWSLFFYGVKTIDLWVMVLFCGLLMFQFAYYPSVVRDAISSEISTFVGWLTPLQGPFSFIIGFLMDYTGTTLIMGVMCLTLIFVNESCAHAPDNNALMRAVALWFIFVQSATYNIKYTFVNEMYDPFNFGKLVGVLGIAGGIGVYCSAPLVEKTNYSTIFNGLSVAAIIMIVLTTFIYYRQYIGITHKTVRAVEQKNRVVNNV